MEKYCTPVQATDDKITRHMRSACWITKATNTQSDYVIHIGFLLQQRLHGRATKLHKTSIACLVTLTAVSLASTHSSQSTHYVSLVIFGSQLVLWRQ